jgi:DNA polymerase III delta prime subunit
MNEIKELWVDKYAPKTLDDYVLNPDLKEYFKAIIEKNAPQNCLFAGIQGSGKTTLAKILARQLNAETMFIKCATDGTLDVLRTKISEFCNAMSIEGRPKIIILDELDSASSSGVNNFQLALRTLIESAQSDTRFLCTCNNIAKIVPAVLSRCPLIPLKFDKKDLLYRVKFILDSEQIKYTKESLKSFIEESFKYYPDCRRIVNYLQFCCGTGELVVKISQIADSGKDEFLKELFTKTLTEKDLLDVRRFYLGNKEKISDFITFGSDIFNYALDNNIVTEDGTLVLADQLYQLNIIIDKEVGIFAMITAIRKYKRG